MRDLLKFLFYIKGRTGRFNFFLAWGLMAVFVLATYYFTQSMYVFFAPLILLAISIKRLHDINLSAFYILVLYQVYGLYYFKTQGMSLLTVGGYSIEMGLLIYYMLWPTGVLLLYLMIKKGTHGSNKFGNDPLWKKTPRVPLGEFLSWRGIALKGDEKHK